MNSSSEEIAVTLASTSTGHSETITVNASTTTLQDLIEWSKALLGMNGTIVLFKDGTRLAQPHQQTLVQVGIKHGDLIAVQEQQQRHRQQPSSNAVPRTTATAPSPAAPAAAAGGLDFSALLGGTPASAPASTPAPAAASSSQEQSLVPPPPVFFPGMSLNDAIEHNPHPQVFVKLWMDHANLQKELNHHNPTLALKLKTALPKGLEECTKIWREELVKGGIRSAMEHTTKFHKEKLMKMKLQQNPNDAEAKAYFQQEDHKQQIDLQYREMMNEYPESMGRVLMLYIEAKVNGHSIQAFVDSGAQNTIMSKRCAKECGVDHLIDTRFEGTAVGVGTGKILGRIHIVSLQIQQYHFPVSVTVMDDSQGLGDKNMDFLLGLDMLKRHTCCIDLDLGVVRFKVPSSEGVDLMAPFLHEKDLDINKGGTRGFDAEKANLQLLERQRKNSNDEEDNDKKMEDSTDHNAHGQKEDPKDVSMSEE
mmetsp:Transcript_25677/g.36224  ORF Transcript_25677/g.36224 Transcript_25677/m.36224 type:complete len:478 (-) Transcript_25677:109-1542(-)